jgi:aspartyl-tRNA(Asn)/glutamyl-tRNA(Gln) amidotransferase subunit A
VDRAGALAAAQRADADLAAGRNKGPLHGVPSS